ncbi:MAG TPA: caspase family protein, partial [Devosia sp.]|nr:caspase family protein [Devosia sp.]
MRRLRIVALALLAATALSTAARPDDARPLRGVALVIGESDYDTLQKLDNPKRDARAMDDMLDRLGFSVDRVLDGDAHRLREAIVDFAAEAKGADVALVYYSGHGIEAGGADYLVPTDTDLTTPQTAGQSLVAVEDLLDELARTVPITIVLLDACRTNSFPAGQLVQLPGAAKPVAVAASGLEAMRGPVPAARPDAPEGLGVVIGFAASPGQPALDGAPDGNSPYATALLKHLSAGGYSFADLMTMVSEEVYLETRARQLPWVNSSLRAVLSFGKPVEEATGDAAAIREGRRQLLLTIASEPAATQRYVEAVAEEQGVPLDALYGMLKVLGVDTAGEGDLEKKLAEGAQKLKDFMAERADAALTDPELARLAGLAQQAQDEGAMALALKYRAEASARADTLSQSLDQTEADLAASRRQLAQTYNAHAQAADLNFDFETAALMWGKAYEQAARWDEEAAVTYKWRQGNALAEQAVHRNDQAAFSSALEAYAAAGESPSISDLTRARIQTSIADLKTEMGESAADPRLMQEAAQAYREALDLYRRQGAPNQAWARVELGLTSVLVYLGDREQGTQSLDQALKAIKDAISLTDKASRPLEWAQAQSTLGNVLRLIGDHTGDPAQYAKSAQAQRAAVAALDEQRTPLDWATAQANLGASLMRLGEAEQGTDSVDAAIAAFEAALAV